MVRFLILIGVLFAIITGFAYLKDTPGDFSLTINQTNYSMDLAAAAAGFLILVVIAMLILWLLRVILLAPSNAVKGWRGRRELKARRALAKGYLAIAAGDVEGADIAAREAGKNLPGAPMTLLLNAQAAQLKGDQQKARLFFNEMIERPETQVVGLRGLHIEANREGEEEAARQYAEKAQETGTPVPWANRALLKYQTTHGEWDMALATLALAEGSSKNKKAVRRKRAVILTAKALDLESGEPDTARKAALEAHNLAPDLVPAALVAGRLLSRHGDVRRAAKVLESTWKQNPHPDLAYAFAHARAGDSARDRLKRSETLQKLRPQADEGRLAVARSAIEAREWTQARQSLEPIIKTRPTQNALMLMSEIEEGENGDSGRAREWLSRAVMAPRDKAWVSDGMILDDWQPVSPVSGELDTVEWKIPAQRLGPEREFKIEDLDVVPPPASERQSHTVAITPLPQGSGVKRDSAEDAEILEPALAQPMPQDASPDQSAEADAHEAEVKAVTPSVSNSDKTTERVGDNQPTEKGKAVEIARDVEGNDKSESSTQVRATAQTAPHVTSDNDGAVLRDASESAEKDAIDIKDGNDESSGSDGDEKSHNTEQSEEPEKIGNPPLPDDPGVDETTDEPEPKRFKLF